MNKKVTKSELENNIYNLLDENKYIEAIEQCDNYLQNFRSSISVLSNRGISFFELEKYQSAIEDFTLLIQLNRKDYSYKYYRGISYINIGLYEQGVSDLILYLKKNKSSTIANYYIAYAFYMQNDIKSSEKYINKSLTLDPQFVNSFLLRAKIFCNINEFNKAINAYNRCIEISPENIDIYLLRGHAYWEKDTVSKAIADYTHYINSGGTDNIALIRRGCINCQNNKLIEAKEDIEKAFITNNNLVDCFRKRACILNKLGIYDLAISDIDEAINLSNDNSLLIKRSKINTKAGNFEAAFSDLNILLQNDNNSEDGLYNRAILYYRLNDAKRAMADINLCLLVNPDNPKYHFLKSKIHLNSEEINESLNEINIAINLDEFKNSYKEYRINILIKMGDINTAYKTILQDINKLKSNTVNQSLLILAKDLAFKHNDYENVLRFINDIIGMKITYLHIHYERGKANYHLKRYGQAVEDLKNELLSDNYDNNSIHLLSWSYYFLNKYDLAILTLTQDIKSENTNNYSYLSRGYFYFKNKDYALAMKDYNEYINLNNDHHGFFKRAILKAELGDHRGAISDFNKSIELEPREGKSYYLRGKSFLALNDHNNGLIDMSKAGELGIMHAYEIINNYN
jgi:tetratricopeptide (TPR) repeat protein